MSDLEITKACARAMGFKVVDDFAGMEPPVNGVEAMGNFLSCKDAYRFRYDPLHDDAQSMALVKRFGIILDSPEKPTKDRPIIIPAWRETHWTTFIRGETFDGKGSWTKDPDLNRAICECVARMAEQGKG